MHVCPQAHAGVQSLAGVEPGLRTLGRIQQVFTHVCVHVWTCMRKHKQCSQPGLQAFVW